MSTETDAHAEHDDIIYPSAIPFLLIHLSALAAIWTGITWQAVAICVTLYWLRIFAIGAGYHRYFSHRAYSTSRAFQFVLAVLSQTTMQKSVLWWASKHRHHHLRIERLITAAVALVGRVECLQIQRRYRIGDKEGYMAFRQPIARRGREQQRLIGRTWAKRGRHVS